MVAPSRPEHRGSVRTELETTHRLTDGGALCGEPAGWLTPCDDTVTCLVCRALLDLEAEERRWLVRRSMVLIAKPASA